MQPNSPPSANEQRFSTWDPELEAIPPDRRAPKAIVNEGEGPWPQVRDARGEDVLEPNEI